MGFEYKIQVASMNIEAFDGFIRNSPFFAGYDSRYKLYNLCWSGREKEGSMPDASLALEKDGIYFCSYCASDVYAILQPLIEEAKKHSNEVVLKEV